MHLLITESEFEQASCRDRISLRCLHCGGSFTAPKNKLQAVRKGASQYVYDYCSRKCQSFGKGTLVECICAQCKQSFVKSKVQRVGKNDFCCSSCGAIYNNTHKTTGTRRSKLETWLESELDKRYPTLGIHYCRKDAIESELDIYIPSLRLAFELNGIFHYEPIYGEEKLGQIQNNDRRKYQACIERGIELGIIDTSGLKYFKPQKAEMYLKIITDLIQIKLDAELPS